METCFYYKISLVPKIQSNNQFKITSTEQEQYNTETKKNK
jgi:hypothetical protein